MYHISLVKITIFLLSSYFKPQSTYFYISNNILKFLFSKKIFFFEITFNYIQWLIFPRITKSYQTYWKDSCAEEVSNWFQQKEIFNPGMKGQITLLINKWLLIGYWLNWRLQYSWMITVGKGGSMKLKVQSYLTGCQPPPTLYLLLDSDKQEVPSKIWSILPCSPLVCSMGLLRLASATVFPWRGTK